MFTAKFITNIIYNGKGLRAIGPDGKPTRVFVRQGDLDGLCSIYSLMMMLIFHQKLDWEDLRDKERAEGNMFVGHIHRDFLQGLNGHLCMNGLGMDDLSEKFNRCFGENLSVVFSTEPGKNNTVTRRELHLKIRAQLDARKPVMLGFHRKSGPGHSVVAVGYRREAWNRLRLFCLDPGHNLLFMQIWNNVIDLDYISNDDTAITDINHYEEDEVYVSSILIIQDNPTKPDLSFDNNESGFNEWFNYEPDLPF